MNNLQYGNLVNGSFKYSKNSIKIYSPIDNSFIGTISAMNNNEIDKCIESSYNSKDKWKFLNIQEKSKILLKAADILEKKIDFISTIMMKEISKSLTSCRDEIIRTVNLIKYTCKVGTEINNEIMYGNSYDKNNNQISFITKDPFGVVLAIVPFNYPINLSASKIAPALIGGNTVIVKPPTQGSMSTLELVKCFHEAGIPAGILNSVTGKGSEIGDYLNSHKNIDFINFTGSTSTGKYIYKTCNMKPVLFELGGKDAALIVDNTNLELACKHIAKGAFDYSGQRCTAIKRIIILKEISNEFENMLVKEIEKLKVGSPIDNCDIVPLIDKKTVKFAKDLYDDAISKGALPLIKFKNEENLMYPTLLTNVTKDMKLAWEEPFAPILPIIKVNNIDELIKIHNESEYGLQVSIFTKNISLAKDIAKKLEIGTVNINQKTQRGPDNFPFLGIKNSGIGVQGIKYSISSMQHIKSIVLSE